MQKYYLSLIKSGALTNPENYRGISLINSISKIFTGILTTQLQKWSEEKRVIDESQAGFRKGYSTIDNIFSLQAIIQKYLCRPRGRFYCIFNDFKRAFDSIPHTKLWNSFQRKGINENSKFMKVFKSMYSQLKSCVKVKKSLLQFLNAVLELFCLLLGPPGFNCWFSSAPVVQWCCSTPQGSPGVGRNTFLSSPHLCFIIVFFCDLFVSRDDPLMS